MAVNGLSWKVALVLFVFSLSVNAKTIYDLRTNYEVAPLSVEGTPVFSWKMDAAGQYKAAQTAYRIIVATSESDWYMILKNKKVHGVYAVIIMVLR